MLLTLNFTNHTQRSTATATIMHTVPRTSRSSCRPVASPLPPSRQPTRSAQACQCRCSAHSQACFGIASSQKNNLEGVDGSFNKFQFWPFWVSSHKMFEPHFCFTDTNCTGCANEKPAALRFETRTRHIISHSNDDVM